MFLCYNTRVVFLYPQDFGCIAVIWRTAIGTTWLTTTATGQSIRLPVDTSTMVRAVLAHDLFVLSSDVDARRPFGKIIDLTFFFSSLFHITAFMSIRFWFSVCNLMAVYGFFCNRHFMYKNRSREYDPQILYTVGGMYAASGRKTFAIGTTENGSFSAVAIESARAGFSFLSDATLPYF